MSVTMSSLSWFFKGVTLLILTLMCFVPRGLALSKYDDKIVTLPGQPPVDFNQYAGYITVDNNDERALFYYFVEAETEPWTKPLVLWLDGGPGCSGFRGAFSGNGPFFPTGQVLQQNSFSWNKEANMLYLDAPAGVGFSYSSNKSYYNFTNDEMTARDNLRFLFGWLEKYPEYKNRDLFITGVSYAGHFVPQLASLILESRIKSNLKGLAIGSPLLDLDVDYNSIATFMWSHGLISDSSFSMLRSMCNVSQFFREAWMGNISSTCLQVGNQAFEEAGISKFVSIHDVLSDVCVSNSQTPPMRGKPDPCVNSKMTTYFNKKEVQEALHAKLVGTDQWSVCTPFSEIGYTVLQDTFVSTVPLLGKFIKGGVRVTIYSGDQDSLIPFFGTRRLINTLAKDLELNTTMPYRSWLHNNQVGGWTQGYGDLLSFATIRGGGHDASISQPERTFAVFQTFLQGKSLPLAPAT